MTQDVLLVVVPEALQAHQDELRRVNADGAVGGVHDGLSRLLDAVDGAHFGLSVQNRLQHVGQLSQPDAAGNAFATGLRMAEIQKIQRHVNGAQTRRAGRDAALHAAVKLVDHGLSLAGRFDIKSAHDSDHSLFFNSGNLLCRFPSPAFVC